MHSLWYPVQSVAQSSARNGPRTSKNKPPAFPRLPDQQMVRDKIGLSKTRPSTRENVSAQKGYQNRPLTRERTPQASLSYRPVRKADHAGEDATTASTPATALPRVVLCGVGRDRIAASVPQHAAPLAAPTRTMSSVRRPPPLAPRSVHTADPSKRRTEVAEWANSGRNTSSTAKHHKTDVLSSQEIFSTTRSDSGISVLPSAIAVSSQCDASSSEANLKSAIDCLVNLKQTSTSEPNKPSCFTGWLPNEPALERSAIYAPQATSGAATTKRIPRTAKYKKASTTTSVYSFQHYPNVEDYSADYLRHHSFTYTSVAAFRPPPSVGVKYSVQQFEPNSALSDGSIGESKSAESCESTSESTSTATKNSTNLIKRSVQQPAAAAPIADFVLLATGTDHQEAGQPTLGLEGKHSRPATSENGSGGFKRMPLVAIKEEHKESGAPSGSSISLSKYLIIKSNEDQQSSCSKSQQKDEEEDEGFGSASMGSLVHQTNSFIQEFGSAASLSLRTDSHDNLVEARLPSFEKHSTIPDMYKYPFFKPVLPAENRGPRATDQVMNKARTLGLISPFVLRERFIQDLLQGKDSVLTKQPRANSYLVRKESANNLPRQVSKSTEKEKPSRRQSAAVRTNKQPISVTEARQRRLSAVMKAYGCREQAIAKSKDSNNKSSNSGALNVPPANTSAVCTKVLLLQRRAKANGKARQSQSAACSIKTNPMESALQIGPLANFSPIK